MLCTIGQSSSFVSHHIRLKLFLNMIHHGNVTSGALNWSFFPYHKGYGEFIDFCDNDEGMIKPGSGGGAPGAG